jgi:colanic acid/amylovoran biosynthesis glycosyltransferase
MLRAGNSGCAKARRLAYLVSEYPAVSHTFILREIRELRTLNWDIKVASINRSARPVDELTKDEREETCGTFYVKAVGVSGATIPLIRTFCRQPGSLLKGLFYALALAQGDPRQTWKALMYFVEATVVGDWMHTNELNHLHVHFASEAATVGLIASRIFPIGFTLTVHGPDEFYDTQRYYLSEKIKRASFIACISHFARSQLMKLSPPEHWMKLRLAPLGVDSSLFKPERFQSDYRRFEILCVGRLVPAKGQHVLLGAIDRLHQSGRRVHLRFVGAGPDRGSLEQEVKCRSLSGFVHFEGGVSQEHIRKFYSEADVFALASSAEGVPVVLMEAMAMEIPCVATHVCGIPELIRNEVDGLLVAPSDERGLADAITRLIDDSELRRSLGRAGRQRIREKHELSVSVKRISQLFEKYV